VRWTLSVVLICISFIARDNKHFFMCFLAIWTSSFEKVLFSLVAYFIGSLIFEEFSFLSSMYTLVISSLSDV
jgi:type IV secretory pathway TrbL component